MHDSAVHGKFVTGKNHFGTNDGLLRSTDAAILPSPKALPVELYLFDGDYVQRLRDGDPATESHFVSYFRQILRIKLRARHLDTDIIEDLQQETFIRVFRTLRADGLRQPERIGAYVNTVCTHVLQEHYRSHSRNQPLQDTDLERPDKVLNLEKLLIAEEVRERVRQALESLSARERDIVRAVFFLDTDKDDVCRQFRVNRDYLRVLLHRAIEHLREVLQQEHPPPVRRETAKGRK
jgi:RNA polymerase sigma-70 factor (ECF subfamily)